MPEVADGDHGGLGRAEKGKNDLDDGYFFIILTSYSKL